MSRVEGDRNIDPATVTGFGDEWEAFDQLTLDPREHRRLFEDYFSTFPWQSLPADAEGFDLGCGSGRWAQLAGERVGRLHCIDPSSKALDVARRRLGNQARFSFHLAGADSLPLDEGSQDFGYSLGVLHHVPDTRKALRDCVRKLKPGAPFLVYLYYRFDNRPVWFRALWALSDIGRQVVCRLPFTLRKALTNVIAALTYWPLAKMALVAERFGVKVSAFPLSAYRHCSFYTMRTDALDRFGTRLEQRFTRVEIAEMMKAAGLTDLEFRETEPFWTACGRRFE